MAYDRDILRHPQPEVNAQGVHRGKGHVIVADMDRIGAVRAAEQRLGNPGAVSRGYMPSTIATGANPAPSIAPCAPGFARRGRRFMQRTGLPR